MSAGGLRKAEGTIRVLLVDVKIPATSIYTYVSNANRSDDVTFKRAFAVNLRQYINRSTGEYELRKNQKRFISVRLL